MDNIKIDKLRDYIIVEQYDNVKEKVMKGSKFYCGCCGNILGVAKINMKFPFSVPYFKKNTKNKTFDCSVIGLYHKTCGHTMFSFKGYNFIGLGNYLKETNKV